MEVVHEELIRGHTDLGRGGDRGLGGKGNIENIFLKTYMFFTAIILFVGGGWLGGKNLKFIGPSGRGKKIENYREVTRRVKVTSGGRVSYTPPSRLRPPGQGLPHIL